MDHYKVNPIDGSRQYTEIGATKNIGNLTAGTYQLTVKDQNQCVNQATVEIENIEDLCSSFFVPNAFTPGGDDKNDLFMPVFYGLEFSKYQFSIFNRWGEAIFTTSNPKEGWDGSINGKIAELGVYVYKIVFEANNHHQNLSGKITLIK